MADITVPDHSGLRRLFAKPTFDVNRFVQKALRDGHESAENMVVTLLQMSDEASSKIKQVIFEHYRLFIKAGKAATELEATMHHIHSDFMEMQLTMNSFAQLSLFNESFPGLPEAKIEPERTITVEKTAPPKSSEYSGVLVRDLFDLIESASQVLSDDINRLVIFDGELRELSVDTQTMICVARLFLLRDLLLIAYAQSGRSTTSRYRIQALVSLENISVLNLMARERRHFPPDAFKISYSAVTRIFQADSPASKSLWMKMLEETKLTHLASQSSKMGAGTPSSDPCTKVIRTSDLSASLTMPSFALPPAKASVRCVRATVKAVSATLPECAELLSVPVETSTVIPGRPNPFDKPADAQATEAVKIPLLWILDVPDDLDVAISERDFTKATNLIVKARKKLNRILRFSDELSKNSPEVSSIPQEFRNLIESKPRSTWLTLSNRIHANESSLAEALQQELITASERHGAPRSVSTAVINLGSLGKGILATQLYLFYRSNLMAKALTHGVRQEGNQLLYFNKLSFAFHRNLAETAVEWRETVVQPLTTQANQRNNQTGRADDVSERFASTCSAKFYSWAVEETCKFSEQIRLLMLDSRSVPFHVVAAASRRILSHADKITELLGVDVRSPILATLTPTWQKAAEAQSRILMDAVEHHAKQESWSSPSPKQAAERGQELFKMGLIAKPSDGAGLALTSSTLNLVRLLYNFIQGARRLQCDEMDHTISRCIADISRCELQNYKRVLEDPKSESGKRLIVHNLDFLVRRVLVIFTKRLNCLLYQEFRDVMRDFIDLLDRAKQ